MQRLLAELPVNGAEVQPVVGESVAPVAVAAAGPASVVQAVPEARLDGRKRRDAPRRGW